MFTFLKIQQPQIKRNTNQNGFLIPEPTTQRGKSFANVSEIIREKYYNMIVRLIKGAQQF